MCIWDRSTSDSGPPYLVVAQAVLLEFVFFEQMHLPLKRQKRRHYQLTFVSGTRVFQMNTELHKVS